ncbi:hypothetical protein [Nostoc sp.]
MVASTANERSLFEAKLWLIRPSALLISKACGLFCEFINAVLID